MVKTEGHDFIKDRISFAVDVSTVEELADAIAFELEKGQKAKRAISGEPFKIQFFDPEWANTGTSERSSLSVLKVEWSAAAGTARSPEPVKTKWTGQTKRSCSCAKTRIVQT